MSTLQCFQVLQQADEYSCQIIESFIVSSSFEDDTFQQLQELKRILFKTQSYIDSTVTIPYLTAYIPQHYDQQQKRAITAWIQCALQRINQATLIKCLEHKDLVGCGQLSPQHLINDAVAPDDERCNQVLFDLVGFQAEVATSGTTSIFEAGGLEQLWRRAFTASFIRRNGVMKQDVPSE